MRINNRYINTSSLLRAMSSRLSSRKDCRQQIYWVTISITGEIEFKPYTYVFPDTHHRVSPAKLGIVEYVLNKPEFEHLHPRKTKDGRMFVDHDSVVPGEFVYDYLGNTKLRRWMTAELRNALQ